jgi:hypothetical protein
MAQQIIFSAFSNKHEYRAPKSEAKREANGDNTEWGSEELEERS